jgi:hypothetical protein
MKDNPNEDIQTLKESFDKIEFQVPEELTRYLKFMKKKEISINYVMNGI